MTNETIENEFEDKIELLDINEKLQKSFLGYAMSVIVARALPDIRDGLKPVQRRILFGMNEMGVYSNVAHKKSARIVGDVMGKYHPHGDSSIYDAMVRMAQTFSYRYPLVNGHGNFGNIDGDGAAAMRYTEARMSKISMEMLRDIDKNTVPFVDNYDGSEKEPEILPSKFPNLLVNGSTGIAVGMATNIPPHNLGEVIDGIVCLIDNPNSTISDLMKHIKAPDFPTGGQILGFNGLKSAYETGNGSIVIRSKVNIDYNPKNQKPSIIVTEIPYVVNKTRLIERIAEITKDKIVDGITDIRDESNRNGIRIVIELRKDVNPEVMLNNLYKHTQLQTSFGINMICLVNGIPKTVNLKTILEEYINFQVDVLVKKTKFDLEKANQRLHIIEGYLIAIDNIDEIIELIRKTTDGSEKEKLINKFNLSEIQAQAILDMQLRRLSGLSVEKIKDEKKVLIDNINLFEEILKSKEKQLSIIRSDLLEVKDKYNDSRKSEICFDLSLNIDNEDLIPSEDVIVTITNIGYAKRIKQDEYKVQSRGGRGSNSIKTKDDDEVGYIIPMNTHDYVYMFTNKGRVYVTKGYNIPECSKQSKGLPLINIINLDEDEEVRAITSLSSTQENNKYVLLVTKCGLVKKTNFSEFESIYSKGKIAIKLRENDEVLSVFIVDGTEDLIIASSYGRAVRYPIDLIRPSGRATMGSFGIKLEDESDFAIGSAIIRDENDEILAISEYGYGKKTKVSEYNRVKFKHSKGVLTLNVQEKNGKLVKLCSVNNDNDIMITTDKGIVIRTKCSDISLTSRVTQGVKLINLIEGQKISNIAIVNSIVEEEICEDEEIDN